MRSFGRSQIATRGGDFPKSVHETMEQPVLIIPRGSLPVNFLRSDYAWSVREENDSGDVPMKVMISIWEILSA